MRLVYRRVRQCRYLHTSLRKIPKFHLISWCGKFVEKYSSGDLPETLRKYCAIPQNFHTSKVSVFYAGLVQLTDEGLCGNNYRRKNVNCFRKMLYFRCLSAF